MSKNLVEMKIEFYGALVELLRDEEFAKPKAEALVSLYEEIKNDVSISISDITAESLREAYEELRDSNRDLEIMESFTENAFEDLARQMRIPEVRRIFRKLTEMSGTFDGTDVFVRIVKTKPLGRNPERGPAVVTLVVSHLNRFEDLLQKTGKVEFVHYSEETKTT